MPDSKLTTLTDAATDVLYAVFFRGALLSGDVPSKSGANELLDAGLTCSKHTATPFGGEDYFTYLTAEGQQFAIDYLVNTCFGVAQKSDSNDSPAITLKIAVDTSAAQAAIEEIDKHIRNSETFKTLNKAASIKESMIQPVSIAASAIAEEAATRFESIAKEALKRRSEIVAERFAIFGESGTSNETIEQRTLSAVLSNSLHLVDAAQAGDAAFKLGQAVKSAFQTLNSVDAAGGKMSQQWGVKMDSTGNLPKVDSHELMDHQPDAHDPVSLKDIKASREDDMLTFGGYPGALFTGKVAVNAAAAESRVVLTKEMNEAIGKVVLNVIKEQTKPGGLLYHHSR
ncbi:hypothetical protein CHU32_13735 [Superficieibacter electus]|uniref:Uncharacterized protein n=1 Tax=Superficieibacter electus TaxID=2022662 RepID=A0A2P5GP70_9ENTR|nr:hypothetical protein [Superficieibacter electus]POP44939.1 hypothetical protein CHU33_10810 [Superficieibacter electus]POP48326.1 hypothetical protein CHU32_13735 [Superficieibacter electus]